MYVSILMISIIILIILLLEQRKKDEKELSKDSTTIIKGLLAIGILFHHISQGLSQPNYVINNVIFLGNLFVGGFFFFSGYGLLKSYILKGKEYRKGFLLKRLLPIIIPYIIISFAIYGENQLIGMKGSFIDFLSSFISLNPYVIVFWYVYAIIFAYLIYYVLMLIVKNAKIIPWMMLIISIIVTIICKDNVIPYWWYHGIIPLPIGMLYCLYEKKILDYANRKYFRLLLISILTLAASTYWLFNGNYYLALYPSIFVEVIQILSFCSILLLVAQKFEIKSKLFSLIGSVSYEIYLCQCFVFAISNYILFRTIGRTDISYFLLTLILIVPISKLFNMLNSFIIGKIFKKKK